MLFKEVWWLESKRHVDGFEERISSRLSVIVVKSMVLLGWLLPFTPDLGLMVDPSMRESVDKYHGIFLKELEALFERHKGKATSTSKLYQAVQKY